MDKLLALLVKWGSGPLTAIIVSVLEKLLPKLIKAIFDRISEVKEAQGERAAVKEALDKYMEAKGGAKHEAFKDLLRATRGK
jgi:hypothetical protein